jgi:hypothetical protein
MDGSATPAHIHRLTCDHESECRFGIGEAVTCVNALRVPDGFGPAARAFWRSCGAYELSPGELAILKRCCRTLDLLARIDRDLAVGALLVPGSMGQLRASPLLDAKAQQERVFELLVRGLALPLPGEREGRRRTPSQVVKFKEAGRGQVAR